MSKRDERRKKNISITKGDGFLMANTFIHHQQVLNADAKREEKMTTTKTTDDIKRSCIICNHWGSDENIRM